MSTYKVRRISWEEVEIDDAELVTMQAAAELVGVALQTVQSEMERGRLTVVVDPNQTWRGRRLLLRKEVEAWKEQRREGGGRRKRPIDA